MPIADNLIHKNKIYATKICLSSIFYLKANKTECFVIAKIYFLIYYHAELTIFIKLLKPIIMEETFIESRVVLGLLCLVHLFVNYAGATGAVRKHIDRSILNSVILAEIIVVTAYIVYDNFCAPPHDGWFMAVIGYLIVYGLILLTWLAYCTHSILDKNKSYEMDIASHIRFLNEDYFRGTVIDDNQEVDVLMPFDEKYLVNGKPQKVTVKFKEIIQGLHITVTPV